MMELPCYDLDGNLINHFTQYDVNRIIVFDNLFSSVPYVDFWNKKQENSIRMESTLNSNGQIQVEVPNILLLESYVITMYIYVQDDVENIGKTVYTNIIPVRPKAMPSDSEYSDNVHVVSVIALERKLNELIEEMNTIIEESKT